MSDARWRQWLPCWLGGNRDRSAYIASGPAGTIDLRFASGVAQSRMRRNAPDLLVVDYTRTMLAALLWQPSPQCIGLGGGSQAKFLYRHLPQVRIEALEISSAVLALRERFHVPRDDSRFSVVQADAAEYLPAHPARYDLLLVDAYDARGIPAALGTPAFHAACQAALRDGGALATNLYCDDHSVHFARLRAAFQGQAMLFDEPRQSNRVAFAWKGTPARRSAEVVLGAMPAAAGAQLRTAFRRVQVALEKTAS